MTKFLTENEIAFDVYETMTPEDIAAVRQIQLYEMIKYHGNVGMFIRNTYHLWDKEHPLTKRWSEAIDNKTNEFIINGVDHHPNHPDAVSTRILGEIWRLVHDTFANKAIVH